MKIVVMIIVVGLTIGSACEINAQQRDDFGTLIFNKQICIGMSFANVEAAWGQPSSVHRFYNKYGVVEYWFMKNGWLVEFENGKVSSMYQAPTNNFNL